MARGRLIARQSHAKALRQTRSAIVANRVSGLKLRQAQAQHVKGILATSPKRSVRALAAPKRRGLLKRGLW